LGVVALLALIGLGCYGCSVGWFKQAASKAGELFASARFCAGQIFGKTGASTSANTFTSTNLRWLAPAAGNGSGDLAGTVSPADPSATIGHMAGGNSPALAGAPGDEDNLHMARRAFAAGDINAAVESYRALIDSNPDSIAALGELGNVFYSSGMAPAAAQVYFDAANKAIDQNQVDIAANLLPAIGEGNPMLAARLNDRLMEGTGRGGMGQPGQPMPPLMPPGDRY
jgi:tetratricopeptide (TPR) repeat protein